MEQLLANIQASRNTAVPILYGNDLQLNSGVYFRPEREYQRPEVPAPPPALFRENGATTEIDNRSMMVIAPQVPRNPELEELNEYFNQQKTSEYARSRELAVLPESLAKQGEMMASNIVRDELERRSGIRRSVLEATGLTPAQIQVQMVQEQLGGVNGRVIDMRDRQVTDAVNLFYSINNLPIPVQTPTTADAIPRNLAPADLGRQEPTEEEAGLEFNDGGREENQTAEDIAVRRLGEDDIVPERRQRPLPVREEVPTLTNPHLADLIIQYGMFSPLLLTSRGRLMAESRIRSLPKITLIEVVLADLDQRTSAGGAEGGVNRRTGGNTF
jgi:hypothetical protein